MAVVLSLFFGGHRPFIPSLPGWSIEFDIITTLQSLANRILDIASMTLICVVAGAVGRAVLQRICPAWTAQLSDTERLAGEALLGLGAISVLIFMVGLVWLHAISVFLLLAILAILTRDSLLGWSRDFANKVNSLRSLHGWNRVLLLFIVLNLLMALLMALAPPTKFDSLTYHLLGPKLWVQDTKFTALEENHFFAFPQQVQILFAGQMALRFGRLSSAASIHWLMGTLSLMAVVGYGRRRFGLRIGLLAAVFLLASDSLWWEFSWAYNDLPPLGYAMLIFAALELWTQQRDVQEKWRWLLVAAIFTGLAMSVKYTLVSVGIAGVLYVLVFAERKSLLKSLLLFVVVAALVLAPWLARNWDFYGNPVYPFGPYTGEWDALKSQWYVTQDQALLNRSPIGWVLLPFSVTMLAIEGGEFGSATITPLFILLIPFLMMTWGRLSQDRRDILKRMAVFMFGVYVFWMYSSTVSIHGTQTRLYYSIFPLLALIAAVTLDSLSLLPRKPLHFQFLVNVSVGMVLVIAFNNHLWGTEDERMFLHSRALPNSLGLIDDDTYLSWSSPSHMRSMEYLNEQPQDSQVVFFWETRSLYCDETRITCDEDTILYRWWHDRRTIGDGSAEAIIDHYRQQGVDYLFVLNPHSDYNNQFDPGIANLLTPADQDEWDNVPALLELVWDDNQNYMLYKIPES
jgi:hypothetical protein